MTQLDVREKLLKSWVTLSGIFKNTRIASGPLVYNEAIVMLSVYQRYTRDGIGMTAVKDIIAETNMLKSLVNRTINSLEEKGLVERCQNDGDRRAVYIRCVKEKLDLFLEVHASSLKVAAEVVDIIGEEDVEHFARIVKKLSDAGYRC